MKRWVLLQHALMIGLLLVIIGFSIAAITPAAYAAAPDLISNKTRPIITVYFNKNTTVMGSPTVPMITTTPSSTLPRVIPVRDDEVKTPLSDSSWKWKFTFDADITNNIQDGQTYKLSFWASDQYENTQYYNMVTFLVDLIPPTPAVSPKGFYTTSNTVPIKITFPEQVTVQQAILTSPDGTTTDIIDELVNNPSTVYSVTRTLEDGHYSLHLAATDMAGNSLQHSSEFIVNAQPLVIQLQNPPFNFTPTRDFNLIISTSKLVNSCKWDTASPPTEVTTNPQVYNSYGTRLHSTDGFTHSIEMYVQTSYREAYIWCNDSYGQVSSPKHFRIYFDNTSPSFESVNVTPRDMTKDPPLINQELLTANLTIRMSDDFVLCNYAASAPSPYSAPLPPAPSSATIPIPSNKGFQIQHSFSLKNPPDPATAILDDAYCYSYAVQCVNRAGSWSSLLTFPFCVDPNAASSISLISPSRYAGATQWTIKAYSTRKATSCSYTIDDHDADPTVFNVATPDGRNFSTSSKITFTEGAHTIKVYCDYGSTVAPLDRTFDVTIDIDPPELNDSDVAIKNFDSRVGGFCGMHDLVVTADAEDSGSGIDYYNFTLVNGSKTLDSSKETDGKYSYENLPLSTSSGYTLKVMAVDRAGKMSNTVQKTIKIIEPDDDKCDKTAPDIDITQTYGASGTTLGIECSDAGSGCDKLYYNTSSSSSSCVPDTSSTSKMKSYGGKDGSVDVVVPNTGKFCYSARDIVGNSRNGSLNVDADSSALSITLAQPNPSGTTGYAAENGFIFEIETSKNASCNWSLASPASPAANALNSADKRHHIINQMNLTQAGESGTLSQKVYVQCAAQFVSAKSEFILKVGDSTPLAVKLKYPPFNFSPEPSFPIIVETNRQASCKWSTLDNIGYVGMTSFFTSTNNPYDYNHTLSSFTIPQQPQPLNQSGFSVICKGPYGIESKRASYLFVYDPTPPVIKRWFVTPNTGDAPPVINERLDEARLTIVTDDDSICSYDPDASPIPQWPMQPDNRFSFTHTLDLLDPNGAGNPEIENKHNYIYSVLCRNKAGNSSNILLANFSVDLDAPALVKIVSPGPYVNTTKTVLNATTNEAGVCYYNLSGSSLSESTTQMNDAGRDHFASLPNLSEGEYFVDVFCVLSNGKIASISSSFIVDTTPPNMTEIKGANPSCSLSRLFLQFKAVDVARPGYPSSGISGIKTYGVTLYNGSSASGTALLSTQSAELTYHGTFLPGSAFTAVAYAIDNAGNKGQSAQRTITVQGLEHTACDITPPKIDITQTAGTRGILLSLACYDAGSGCTNSFIYGLVDRNKQCSANVSRRYDDAPIAVEKVSLFCYHASDMSNNTEKGSREIKMEEQQAQCTDNFQNGFETDKDCGGPMCPVCQIGKKCLDRVDCTSKYCVGNICLAASCTDNAFNQDESDVDCGGSTCQKCAVDKACIANADCISGACLPKAGESEKRCAEASCTDGIMDQDESDVDCGGSCSPCKDNFACRSAADCMKGDCIEGVCNAGATPGEEPGAGGDAGIEEGPSTLKIILLVLGILLILGGTGYLVYFQLIREKVAAAPPTNATQTRSSPSLPPKPETSIEKFKLIQKSKQSKRQNVFSSFEGDEPDSKNAAAPKASTPSPDAPAKPSEKTSEQANAQKPATPNQSNLPIDEEGYVHVFPEGKKTKGGKGAKESLADKDMKAASEKGKPDIFSELSVMGADVEDPFEALSELAGSDAEAAKKLSEKDKLTYHDLLKIFSVDEEIEDKQGAGVAHHATHMDTDAFKAILAHLLGSKRIDQQDVTTTLFEMMDAGLLTNKEVSKIMADLKLLKAQ